MFPNLSSSHVSGGRGSAIPARAPYRRTPHGSALPLLGTMTATLLLAIVVIVLTASGASGNLEVSAYLLA